MNNQESRKQIEEIIQQAKSNCEHHEMLYVEMSKLLFSRYKSLLAAGFNEAQAMMIICHRGLT